VSLIDEALKRAQEAHRDAAQGAAPVPPWTPAPLPDRRRGLRAHLPSVLAGVLLVVLIAAAFLAIGRWPFARPTRTATRPAPAATAPVPVPESAEAALPEITSEALVEPPPRAAPGEPRKAPPAPARKTPPLQPAVIPSVAPPAPERPGRTTAEGRTYVGKALLPGGAKIELGGIVFSQENPTALINGRVVSRGAFVEGFEVTRILPDRVELTGSGTTISVALK